MVVSAEGVTAAMKTRYHLIFRERQSALAAEAPLRDHGIVAVLEEEDDHERVYRVTLTTGDDPPTPFEMDKLARAHGGVLDRTETTLA